jgi:hypothetical protein
LQQIRQEINKTKRPNENNSSIDSSSRNFTGNSIQNTSILAAGDNLRYSEFRDAKKSEAYSFLSSSKEEPKIQTV